MRLGITLLLLAQLVACCPCKTKGRHGHPGGRARENDAFLQVSGADDEPFAASSDSPTSESCVPSYTGPEEVGDLEGNADRLSADDDGENEEDDENSSNPSEADDSMMAAESAAIDDKLNNIENRLDTVDPESKAVGARQKAEEVQRRADNDIQAVETGRNAAVEKLKQLQIEDVQEASQAAPDQSMIQNNSAASRTAKSG